MKQIHLAILGFTISILLTVNVQAENSVTVELAVPPAIAFEAGTVSENNVYVAAKLQLTSGSVFGAEFTFTKASSEAGKHWLGGGLGVTNDSDGDFISDDAGPYVTVNYKFYQEGIRSSGFHFNASLRVYGDVALPAIGFGRNF